ncbi:MAG: hypothetical protein K2M97_02195 [Muribaculaceae bacterium]|nr:hypothetical protein [Muribaculaceae bacterium]
MPKKLKIALFSVAAAAIGCACGRDEVRDSVPEPVVRLDRAVASGAGFDSLLSVGWGDLATVVGAESPAEYASSAVVEVFQPDVDRLLPSLDSVEAVLGTVRAGLAEILPSVDWCTTYAVVWPYSQSVMYGADGNVLVALNHYLGADYPGYQGRFPDYMRVLKSPSRLPADVAEMLIESNYPYVEPTDRPASLLNRMLHQGAVLHAVSRVLPPDTPAATLLGITPGQADWLSSNEAAVWRRMMEADMVYSADNELADRLLRRAPASSYITPDAPGGTARYIGMKIVEAYLAKNPEVADSMLLTSEFYNSTQSLISSQYAPR